jgi:hypothetical protein
MSRVITYPMNFGISVVPVLISDCEVMSPSVGSNSLMKSCDCNWSAVNGFNVFLESEIKTIFCKIIFDFRCSTHRIHVPTHATPYRSE